MSSVSAACIFDAYSASSAHTDTFYIVSQIVRVRNSKRHFFSKLTFPYIIQPLCFTLRSHRPQPPRFHPTATSTTARHFAQQSRLNSSSENFSYFFKKALDKYPKTVYNIYCYLGVAQIGSALPWGGRGRRFKSCHSDHKSTVILIELRWTFSTSENRLIQGFPGISTHNRTPLQSNSAVGFRAFYGYRGLLLCCNR